jgi:para-aminobenzoate synthetase component 1
VFPSLESLILNWPDRRPLAAAWGASWGLVAEPRATFRVERDAGGVTRSNWIVDGVRAHPPMALCGEPIADLRAVLAWGRSAVEPGESPCPFAGGWIGCFSYDLGRVLEPVAERARGGAAADRAWPLIELHWCPSAIAADRISGRRVEVGVPGGIAGAGWLHRRGAFSLGEPVSRTGRGAFERTVERAIEYIHAGDVFQVNLAHRLEAGFSGRTRDLFAALCRGADPWHGAYVEIAPGMRGPRIPRAIVSASPELFLDLEPLPGGGSRITTRPMKGTRPASADPRELEQSGKDLAELTMIIDLMRNDLGRACRVGSVRVADPRAIERHGGRSGVWQAVATVTGELPDGAGIPELLAAAFPAGSVTGAPKIRAMQIIDELEPMRRGPYCGSVGWISVSGHAQLNVAIRTALVSGPVAKEDALDAVTDGVLDYSVGAGIVADSRPAAEWRETLDKAGILNPLRSGSVRSVSSPAASPPAACSTR